MNTTVDGEFQRYAVESGAYIREHFFGPDPRLRKLVEHLSDDELRGLPRGGHDYQKLYAAYKAATEHRGAPTVILAKTVKGWTLGSDGRGPQRHPPDQEDDHRPAEGPARPARTSTTRSPTTVLDGDDPPYYRPPTDSAEHRYLMDRRRALDGPLPPRTTAVRRPLDPARPDGRSPSSPPARAARRCRPPWPSPACCATCAGADEFGPRVVPIIPDEARTFGMDALFRELEIYASQGQLYEPVDATLLLSYTESKDGQILEEGITEAGVDGQLHRRRHRLRHPWRARWCRSSSSIRCSASSGSATSSGPPPTPGPRASCSAPPPGAPRCWARASSTRTATASCWPPPCRPCQAYDPAFAYEMAAIIEHGLHRMYGGPARHVVDGDDVFYYLTLYNENYVMPARPDGVTDDDIVERPLPLGAARPTGLEPTATILFSGTAQGAAREAQAELAERTASASSCGAPPPTSAARGRARRRALEPAAPARDAPHRRRSPSSSAARRARSSPSPTS